ncbi:MAG: PAS domain-containing protein [Stellaceae bacterium]
MSISVKNEWADSRQRDRVIRRRLPLWEPEPPKSKILMDLYRYWESLRPTGLIPSRKEFDILRLRSVMGTASVIDVDHDDPCDFHLRIHGTSLRLPRDLSNQRLADLDYSERYRETLMQDYVAARDTGVPLYHEVAAMIDYITHCYARLILPFAADGRSVNQLIVCSISQDFPDLAQLLH